MLLIHVIIALNEVFWTEAYTNNKFRLIKNQGIDSGGCSNVVDLEKLVKNKVTRKTTIAQTSFKSRSDPFITNTTYIVSSTTQTMDEDEDPILDFQDVMNKVLFGENVDIEEKLHTIYRESITDRLAMYPTGKVLRSELFQNKTGVHLPRAEFLHRGHLYLDTSSKDFMQTAVNAFSILLEGSVEDVLRLPSLYVLRSSRSIAMMQIAREKLVATWRVVKGNQRPEEIGYLTLEYYRPLFKYINGREMARLNMDDDRILSFLGTHPDLDRHQVGVVASEYIKRNPDWSNAKYLNLMNNLLCGVPMKFMRRIPENVYLQLSHQLFYHIKACDPLQRRFYLAMMTRTQVLGKSNSWGARDVARLGLLLSEVEGPDLSAINPEAMAGITPQVMMEMSARNLIYLTETQIRYLALKPRNILTKKMYFYVDDTLNVLNSATARRTLYSCCIMIVIKMLLIYVVGFIFHIK